MSDRDGAMGDRDWTEWAGAYVLDALPPDERAEFEDRLSGDDELRREVAALRETAAALGTTVQQVPPPPGLRARILDDARRVRPLPRRHRAVVAAPWIAAAAALIAALWAGASYRAALSEADALRLAQTGLEEALEQARADVARQDSILATFAGPDVRAATLRPSEGEPSVRVFLDPDRSVVVLAAFDLAPAPAGRTYQLWGLIGGVDPVSLGTFDTDPDGTALLALPVSSAADFELSAVTEEPDGGSPQPTTQPFLVGSWAAVD